MTDNLCVASGAIEDFSFSTPATVFSEVSTSGSAFQRESEDALARRFMRPVKKRPELVYEFTRDPALISQYCRLYESECSSNVPQFHGIQSTYNDKGHIIIVRQGNLCVGGARLSVSTPRQPQLLPLEINGFLLKNYFPELQQKEMRYGGLSRFALLSDFRDGDVARLMFHQIYRKAVALSLDKAFVVAPLVNVRSYRKSALAYGMKDAKIHTEIQMPPYPGYEEIKGYLLSITIDKSLFNYDLKVIGENPSYSSVEDSAGNQECTTA